MVINGTGATAVRTAGGPPVTRASAPPRNQAQARGPPLSSIAFDEFTAVVNGNRAVELEQRRVELLRRDEGATARRAAPVLT